MTGPLSRGGALVVAGCKMPTDTSICAGDRARRSDAEIGSAMLRDRVLALAAKTPRQRVEIPE